MITFTYEHTRDSELVGTDNATNADGGEPAISQQMLSLTARVIGS